MFMTLHRTVLAIVNDNLYLHILRAHRNCVFNQLKFGPFNRSGLCI
jgi:hypothetical protein